MRTHFLLFVLCLGLGTSVLAQNSVISGTVTDPDGPSIGATIKLFQNDVCIKKEMADIDGYYQFDNLKEGEYRVEISLIGYENPIIKKIDVVNNQTNRLSTQFEKPEGYITLYNYSPIHSPQERVYNLGNTVSGLTLQSDFISKHPTRMW